MMAFVRPMARATSGSATRTFSGVASVHWYRVAEMLRERTLAVRCRLTRVVKLDSVSRVDAAYS
jgi:hypothetical protein